MAAPLRLCTLNASYELSDSDFKGLDPYCDPSRYAPGYSWHRALIDKARAIRQVRELAAQGFDAFINLCDGAWEEDRAGIEVVQSLERLGCAFTGAGSGFYEPTREAMKMACHSAGILTPHHCFVYKDSDLALCAEMLRFPMIVKHPNSYGSVGMTRKARVSNREELAEQCRRCIESFGGALVEEFIEGREFTVLVADAPEGSTEPVTYLPVEFRFPPGETFKHFDLKWVDYKQMTWTPTGDPELDARLRSASAALFTSLAGTGYGRCDLRMNEKGDLYMLEINPNCGVFYDAQDPGSADIILLNDPAGHAGFIDHIVRSALRRRAEAQRAWRLSYRPATGWGLFATRALAVGDVVERYEERPQVLVTRKYVERRWDELHRRWFRQYAWPMTDEVHAIWSADPGEWKPINHGCDPNCWLEGLDLVARRPIAEGEELTTDYATFCGPLMEPFDCACGSPLCRRVIKGTDCLLPLVAERYGDHVSDYVRRLRATP